jgi:hypothetical protein
MTASTQEQVTEVKAARVDATGTHRRIQALVANGRPLTEIARLLCRDPAIPGRILSQATVTAKTAEAVSKLYCRIGDRVPQPATAAEERQVAAARRLAERRGWPPSLAWELDQIDDPAGEPVGGWNGWQRRQERGPARWAAVAEDVEFLTREQGLDRHQIAERLGMTDGALVRVLTLAKRAAREQAQQASTELEAEAG